MAMSALTDHSLESLRALLQGWGANPAHAATLLRHLHETAGRFDPADLPIGRTLIERLRLELPSRQSSIAHRHRSADGTEKFMVAFFGGGAVEAVLMPSHRPDRAAGCISSQIGCAMGCDFCASTFGGLERNLTAGEMVEQYLVLRAGAADAGRRLSSLVFMGMGEPMLNLDAVIAAIRRIAAPEVGGIGWRQITVSTVGIVPGMLRLMQADLNVHLALSLHAPDDLTRSRLIPANRRYPVADVIDALRRFDAATGRTCTLEYTLLDGVNDSLDHARRLAELMRGFRAHVNVIPYNPTGVSVSGTVYARPAPERIEAFVQALRGGGVVAHLRRPRGDTISAACGQLQRRSSPAVIIGPGGPQKAEAADGQTRTGSRTA